MDCVRDLAANRRCNYGYVTALCLLTLMLTFPSFCHAQGSEKPPSEENQPPKRDISYAKEIRPILAKKCFSCHGPDDHDRAADLRLDRREDAIDSAITPGSPEESDLLDRIITDDAELLMPPPKSGKGKLTAKEVQLVKDWIQQGAPYQTHWAFAPVKNPPSPEKGHYIDHFISQKAAKVGLKRNPPANRFTIARRVALDLTGMPPTEKQLQKFIVDPRPDAYHKYVDELLASPRFGEHWATMWLDMARYADTDGYADDFHRTIWPYRGWVIKAYNSDMPFDQFTRLQLAGDLLPNPSRDDKVATGFHRNTMTNREGGTIDEEFRIEAIKDRVDTTFQVWNGFTAGCAKCHNHKYDPMSQKEYYRLFAILNQTADSDKPGNPPTIAAGTPEANQQFDKILKEFAKDHKKLNEERRKIQLVNMPVMVELPKNRQRTTHILVKGNWGSKGEKVEAGLPSQFGPRIDLKGRQPNRLDLANWLLHPDHPLTARVQVNRIWAHLFGSGLVITQEDFGTTGSYPSHPLLLDALAIKYRTTHKWSLKKLLKEIVTSKTYRQSSKTSPEQLKKDPQNRLFTRSPRFRLSAEQLRDQALQTGGLLNEKMYGPSVVPRLPYRQLSSAFSNRSLHESKGKDLYRRGVYTFVRRTGPYPATLTFDGGARQTCLCRRIRTNTPLQALTTLNDDVFFEAAQGLARRVLVPSEDQLNAHPLLALSSASSIPEPLQLKRLRLAFLLATGRPATEGEQKELNKSLEKLKTQFLKDPSAAKQVATIPIGKLPKGLTAQQAAPWTVLCNVLLNLDEVLTR